MGGQIGNKGNKAPSNPFRRGFDPRRNSKGQIKPSKATRQLIKEGIAEFGASFVTDLWKTGKTPDGTVVPPAVQLQSFKLSWEMVHGKIAEGAPLQTPAESVIDFDSMTLAETEQLLTELQGLAKVAIEDKSAGVVANE